MKNIRSYHPVKYHSDKYKKIEENIYKTTYYSCFAYDGVEDEELIKKLKNLKDWEKKEDYYTIEYENEKYYIFDNDEECIFTPEKPCEIYVTSLVFEQEPNYGENEPNDNEISQYPLEDILEEFNCFCSDDYEEENTADPINSYQEFASSDIENIRNLMTLIGKHVYNIEDDEYIKLIIE